MILLIDNYDSFSYNLYQYVGEITPDIKVIRNDEMTPEQIGELNPDRIILSPGPGRPENAGCIIDVIRTFYEKIPMLGVCLGHQAICAAFGADIIYAPRLMHGKQSLVNFDTESKIFKGIEKRGMVARYHSLIADSAKIPDCLRITAKTDQGEVMAAEHRDFPVFGVQFHPESIMTPEGKHIIRNFIEIER